MTLVPLLARYVLIGKQPTVDYLRIGIDRRAWSRRIRLARRRDGARQRLAHRAPVQHLGFRPITDPLIRQTSAGPH